MGRTANLSVLGLYNWDDSIFDNLVIPDALDADIVTDNILAECAELEVLYPNPTVFKALIGVWSRKENPVWEKLYATTQYEYNPIENYNRYLEETVETDRSSSSGGSDTVTGTGGVTHGGSDTSAVTHGGSDSWTASRDNELGGSDTTSGESTETNSGTDTNLHKISAFDADSLVDQYSDSMTHGKITTQETEQTTTYGKTEEESETGTNTYGATENTTTTYGRTESRTSGETTAYGKTGTETGEQTTTYHSHGNIGVTTTQKLIKEQRQIDRFNIYDIIVESFKARFCILVY